MPSETCLSKCLWSMRKVNVKGDVGGLKAQHGKQISEYNRQIFPEKLALCLFDLLTVTFQVQIFFDCSWPSWTLLTKWSFEVINCQISIGPTFQEKSDYYISRSVEDGALTNKLTWLYSGALPVKGSIGAGGLGHPFSSPVSYPLQNVGGALWRSWNRTQNHKKWCQIMSHVRCNTLRRWIHVQWHPRGKFI